MTRTLLITIFSLLSFAFAPGYRNHRRNISRTNDAKARKTDIQMRPTAQRYAGHPNQYLQCELNANKQIKGGGRRTAKATNENVVDMDAGELYTEPRISKHVDLEMGTETNGRKDRMVAHRRRKDRADRLFGNRLEKSDNDYKDDYKEEAGIVVEARICAR